MRKILIAVNNEFIRETYSEVFKAENFEVFRARDGKEALDLVKKEKPDIIIADIALSEMGGFELLEELGAEIIEFPTIEIVPPKSWNGLDKSIDRMETYNWLIFTSANGVKFFFKRFFERDKDIRELKGIKICAVGSKTAYRID